jgi:hypothetical protein
MSGYFLAQDSGFQLGSRGSTHTASLSLLDMLNAYAGGFYKVAIELQEIRVRTRFGASDSKPPDFILIQFSQLLELMKEECRNLELDHTLNMILGIEARFKLKTENQTLGRVFGKGYTENDLLSDLDTLEMSFGNELRGELIFRIAPDKNRYFEKDNLFGSEVAAAFPSAIDNIRNAGTCYAVEQWDASVFHLMRVLERGLRVLATKFNIPFQHTTWHTIIEQIEAKVRRMDSSYGTDWKEQQKFYSEAASQFMFLKEAWRNHIMHLGDVYDEGKALSVLTHVRVVLKALAKGGLEEQP